MRNARRLREATGRRTGATSKTRYQTGNGQEERRVGSSGGRARRARNEVQLGVVKRLTSSMDHFSLTCCFHVPSVPLISLSPPPPLGRSCSAVPGDSGRRSGHSSPPLSLQLPLILLTVFPPTSLLSSLLPPPTPGLTPALSGIVVGLPAGYYSLPGCPLLSSSPSLMFACSGDGDAEAHFADVGDSAAAAGAVHDCGRA